LNKGQLEAPLDDASADGVTREPGSNSTPALTDTKSFTVVVNPLAPVSLTPINATNTLFRLQVAGQTPVPRLILRFFRKLRKNGGGSVFF
jgi:hypothetical protein